MGTHHDPTVPRKRLGRRLRELREAAGLKAADVVSALGFSQPKVSTIELGRYKVTPVDVRAMLGLYGINDLTNPEHVRIVDELVELAKLSGTKAWWHPYRAGVPDWFAELLGLESAASLEKTYNPYAIPGPLQTRRYAEGVTAASKFVPVAIREQVVAVRQGRADRLTEGPDPLRLHAIIDRHVLRRAPRGDVEGQVEQLRHLAEMATLDNVVIQVLPETTTTWATEPVLLLAFPSPEVYPHTVAYLEHQGGAQYLESDTDVALYEELFASLTRDALGEDRSLQVIRETAEEIRQG